MLEFRKLLTLIGEKRPDVAAPANLQVEVKAPDEAEMVPEHANEPEPSFGFAEGQCFGIEYVASDGEESRRRITVWDIKLGKNGIPCLLARCHERNATRQFRIDRIQSIIDLDGEIFEPPTEFLIEIFGMDPVFARAAETGSVDMPEFREQARIQAERAERWQQIRDIVVPEMKILAALSLSDGYMQADERGEIVAHLLSLIAHLEPSLEEEDRLVELVKRQRPSPGAVDRAIEQVGKYPRERLDALWATCVRVIEADGQILEEELEFLRTLGVQPYTH
ncbi:tellurite resistance TerB family protein [Marinicauda salina]|nr:WYL domain-containing protein [Marinicauda salina]